MRRVWTITPPSLLNETPSPTPCGEKKRHSESISREGGGGGKRTFFWFSRRGSEERRRIDSKESAWTFLFGLSVSPFVLTNWSNFKVGRYWTWKLGFFWKSVWWLFFPEEEKKHNSLFPDPLDHNGNHPHWGDSKVVIPIWAGILFFAQEKNNFIFSVSSPLPKKRDWGNALSHKRDIKTCTVQDLRNCFSPNPHRRKREEEEEALMSLARLYPEAQEKDFFPILRPKKNPFSPSS